MSNFDTSENDISVNKSHSPARSTDDEQKDYESLLFSEKESDMTIICGDGEEICAHQHVLCSKSEYFSRALNGNFEESITKKLSLSEPSFIVRPVLRFMYTEYYFLENEGLKNDERLKDEEVLEWITSGTELEVHVHIAAMADRLIIPSLLEYAKKRIDKSPRFLRSDGWWLFRPPWTAESVDKFLRALYLLYDENSDLEAPEDVVRLAKEWMLAEMGRLEFYGWLVEKRPDEPLLTHPALLKDLVLHYERNLEKIL